MYQIRLARKDDVDALVNFIDTQWKKNHIFVTDRALLDWQHRTPEGDYNFVLGVHEQTGAVHGILGFIPLKQFDPHIPLERLGWMAIWKTHDDARGHKLGRRLMDFLEDMLQQGTISTVAASAMTLPMYEARGYQMGKLAHYFILNPDKTHFQMIDVPGGYAAATPPATDAGEKDLALASESDVLDCPAALFDTPHVPRKSAAYVVGRYMHHPTYEYQTYKISQAGKVAGLIVTRLCGNGQARAIRIVDFLGDSRSLAGLALHWKRLLRHADAEYIDFYNAGISDADLKASGFSLRVAGDGLVIPNYFEPFTKVNIEIDYMISTPAGTPFRIVKGDSDQDRPNIQHSRT